MAFSYADLCEEAAAIFHKVDPQPFDVQNWLKEYERTCGIKGGA